MIFQERAKFNGRKLGRGEHVDFIFTLDSTRVRGDGVILQVMREAVQAPWPQANFGSRDSSSYA